MTAHTKRTGWFAGPAGRLHSAVIVGSSVLNGDDAALFVAAHGIDRKRTPESPPWPPGRVPARGGSVSPQTLQDLQQRGGAGAVQSLRRPGPPPASRTDNAAVPTGHRWPPSRANSAPAVRRHGPQHHDGAAAPAGSPVTAPEHSLGSGGGGATLPPPAATPAAAAAPPADRAAPEQQQQQQQQEQQQLQPPQRADSPAGGAPREPTRQERGPSPRRASAPAAAPAAATEAPAAGGGRLENWHFQEQQGAPTQAPGSDRVVIHVYDELNNMTRDFTARRDALLRDMRYFRSYLTADCATEDLDISVHCDINIFRWLMEYVHSGPGSRPRIETPIAVSILISSDFLEMTELVQQTLQFVAQHLQEIVKLPIDLDCINRDLVARLAGMFGEHELDAVRDRKDKIVGALFLHKLEHMLRPAPGGGRSCTLMRCALCGKIFTQEQKSWSVCTKSAPHITFHGNAVSEHVADHHWDINAYLARLRGRRMSWREIYWRVWALVHDDRCRTCNRHFTYAELGHCAYHHSLPSFPQGSSVGVYPCCGAEVRRFESGAAAPPGLGCAVRQHTLSQRPEAMEQLMTVVQRHPGVLIPWTAQRGRGEITAADLEGVTPQRNSDYVPPQETGPAGSETQSTSSDDAFGADWRRRSRNSRPGRGCAESPAGGDLRRLFHSFPRPQPQAQHILLDGRTETATSGAASSASSDAPLRPGARRTAGRRARRGGTRRSSQPAAGARGGGGGAAPAAANGGGAAAPAGERPAPGGGPSAAAAAAGGRERSGPSSDWWARLGAKARTAYFLDTQRETDSRRFASLVRSLEKRRRDRVDDRFERRNGAPAPAPAAGGPRVRGRSESAARAARPASAGRPPNGRAPRTRP